MDAEEWSRRTEIPVYPGKVQRWILVRHSDDDVAQAEVETDAVDALAKWLGFPHRGLLPGVKVVSSRASLEEPRVSRRMSKRPEELPELVAVKGQRPWWVELEWTSTSSRTELPWPVLTRSVTGWHWEPSMEADWMLRTVDKPRAPTVEEKPKSPMERVEETAKDVASAFKGVAIVPGLFAVAYVGSTLIRRV